MPRLFTALELPDHVRESLVRLRAPLAGAHWIEPEDFHITLRFAGDISKPTASEFRDALAGIRENAFEARLSGLGTFGSNQPRALWAGVEAGPELDALQRANERAARYAGLDIEKRAWIPHVTLARLKGTRPEAVAKFLEGVGAFRTRSFDVERFALFSARPQVGGGPYVIEEEFYLTSYAADADMDEGDDL